MRISRLVTFGMLFGATQIVHANLVANGSFESPASSGVPSLGIGSTYLSGWEVVNAEIAQQNPASLNINASDGTYSLDLTGYHDGTPYGGVRQVVTTIPFAVYSISFDVGAWEGTSAVQISAGSLLDTGLSTSPRQSVAWTTFTSTFTASDSTTTIDLIGAQSSWGGIYIGLDNVIVELDHLQAVPIPSVLLLFGSGLFGVIGLRVFKRRKSSS